MVKVRITLRHTSEAWYIVSYQVDTLDTNTALELPSPPTRKFVSQTAAENYVGRIVLTHLRMVNMNVTGPEVTYDVCVRSNEDLSPRTGGPKR